jgi:hypothetical protein
VRCEAVAELSGDRLRCQLEAGHHPLEHRYIMDAHRCDVCAELVTESPTRYRHEACTPMHLDLFKCPECSRWATGPGHRCNVQPARLRVVA